MLQWLTLCRWRALIMGTHGVAPAVSARTTPAIARQENHLAEAPLDPASASSCSTPVLHAADCCLLATTTPALSERTVTAALTACE